MRTRTILLLFVVSFSILTLTPNSFAVSEATALFLRIAPGARAAGMGEAFVAVSDDATATHWNPAGLGVYPLSNSWKDANVPRQYRPLKSIAALKKGSGSDFKAYEIWAISNKGLVRYDNHRWYEGEVFTLRSSDKVERKVKAFFGIENDEILKSIVTKVAEFNSKMTFEELKSLQTEIISQVPKDYSRLDEMNEAFDSLIYIYNECRVNWDKTNEIIDEFNKGMKDSTLSESECEKINFAIHRSRSRFVPEEITIPFSAIINGEITSIASEGHTLMVGTTEGLYNYTGKRWRILNDVEGLPSTSITCLQVISGTYYIGTDKGLITYRLGRFEGFGNSQKESIVDSLKNALNSETEIEESESVDANGLPTGYVSAISSNKIRGVWAIIDNDLYRFYDGTWSNSFEYTVAIDETYENIAEKFLIYGSSDEKENFISKMFALNSYNNRDKLSSSSAEETVPSEEVIENNSDTTEVPTETEMEVTEEAETVESLIKPVEEDNVFTYPDMKSLNPGDVINVPYITEIRGNVTSIYTVANDIWLGTDFGLIHFNGKSWSLPGYKNYVVSEGVTLDTLVTGYNKMKRNSVLTENYKQSLIAINDLDDESINTGDTIKIYQNPTSANVNYITGQFERVYFATSDGLHLYDSKSKKLKPVSEKGMNKSNAIYISTIDDQLWLASDEKIVIKANARNEISLMAVNWLPELADDMYYGFLSYIHHINGFGTAGFSFTYLTYGKIELRDEHNNPLGDDEPFEYSAALSFGAPLTKSLSGGISTKIIYSRLANDEIVGASTGAALGDGKAFGIAVDLGLLYQVNPKLNLGLAVTNLGPDLQYSQDAQSDPIPRNMALGFSYKLIESDYNRLLVTAETNKLLVRMGNFKEEVRELIFNGGIEFVYANIISPRIGYIYDQDGKVKTLTLGIGLNLINKLGFDFAYIPSSNSGALSNILRISLQIIP